MCSNYTFPFYIRQIILTIAYGYSVFHCIEARKISQATIESSPDLHHEFWFSWDTVWLRFTKWKHKQDFKKFWCGCRPATPSGPASLLTPLLASISASADPTTAPRPMRKVWILKPDVLCLSGRLSATRALKGSIAILKEASITITIPAPIHNAGTIDDNEAELGRKTSAVDERMAPAKK